MSPPAVKARKEHAGGVQRPEQVLRHAHDLLEGWGITLSPGKVRKLVREYLYKVQPHGVEFETYLLSAAIEASDQRARQAAGKFLDPEARSGRPTAHSDHVTGETATWNVFVDRDLPRLLEDVEQPIILLKDIVPDSDELRDILSMADVSVEQFEEVLAEARAEDDLTRANVARKCRAKAHQ